MLAKLLSAVSWRGRFLARDRRFALRERLAYVNPWGRQLTEAELIPRSVRRGRDGRAHYALGGWRILFEPEGGPEDADAYREGVELLLRETFLQDELLDCEHVGLREGDVVLDLGASIGVCSLPFSRAVGPAGSVHAFEPLVPEVLSENLAINGAENVAVVPSAVSDRPGEAELAFNDDYVSASFARVPGRERDLPVRRRRVPLTTVDAYVEEAGLDRVDLIKLDVEGAEELALRGATETLERFRPRLTVASYHTDHEGDPQHPKLVRLLAELGYRLRELEQRRIYAW